MKSFKTTIIPQGFLGQEFCTIHIASNSPYVTGIYIPLEESWLKEINVVIYSIYYSGYMNKEAWKCLPRNQACKGSNGG